MIPYKNENEFVRGQKIKLIIIFIILTIACVSAKVNYGSWFGWWR